MTPGRRLAMARAFDGINVALGEISRYVKEENDPVANDLFFETACRVTSALLTLRLRFNVPYNTRELPAQD